jgi:hypothetical protein
MPLSYRSPGVYLEESLLVNSGQIANATSVACFVGAAPSGPVGDPVLIQSWSQYVTIFGGFNYVPTANANVSALSYLPYSVYSYFQNGGRVAYIVRAVGDDDGSAASKGITGQFKNGATTGTVMTITAKSPGKWGNDLSYSLIIQETKGTLGSGVTEQIFTLQILYKGEIVETFSNLSLWGTIAGTFQVEARINDAVSGSQYVSVATDHTLVFSLDSSGSLTGGTTPSLPTALALKEAVIPDGDDSPLSKIDGPIVLNIAGYIDDYTKENTDNWANGWVGATVSAADFSDRNDIFIVNDNCPPREPSQSVSSYVTTMTSGTSLNANSGDSYVAAYGPWILISDPQKVGQVKAVPPGGAVVGVYARTDATVSPFRAPAGAIAGITNAVGVQAKFSEAVLGTLNSDQNINVIRSVTGSGIAIMGARTKKKYGVDRYVSARRTLIYLRESLRRSMQFAVFQNNDERLWSAMRITADRVLRNVWLAGGLSGNSANQAYYINCDAAINSPAVISTGEARVEIGVALEYPAEFIVIRLTQFDQTTSTREITTSTSI